MQLRSYWSIGYGGDRNFEFYDDLDTRGGPPIVKPRGISTLRSSTATRASAGASA